MNAIMEMQDLQKKFTNAKTTDGSKESHVLRLAQSDLLPAIGRAVAERAALENAASDPAPPIIRR